MPMPNNGGYNAGYVGATNFGQPTPLQTNQTSIGSGAFYGQPQPTPQMPYASAPTPQQMSAPGFSGRYISEVGEIIPKEVPMDGSVAIFPNKDLSEIFLKSWCSDGRILTFRYALDTSVDLNAQTPQPQQNYQDLATRLADLEAQVRKTSNRGRNRQEEEANK